MSFILPTEHLSTEGGPFRRLLRRLSNTADPAPGDADPDSPDRSAGKGRRRRARDKQEDKAGKKEVPRFQQGMWPLIVGADNRTSTSKLQFVLWTYSVGWALFALLLMGARNFEGIFDRTFKPEYLVLLGAPATALVFAKYITTSRSEAGEIDKTTAEDTRRLESLVGQVVSDDENRGDISKFQYFLFNLLALGYFFARFTDSPRAGLPTLPSTLVALTGSSALLYVARKNIQRDTPVLSSMVPEQAAVGEWIDLRGRNLIGSDKDGKEIKVKFGGRLAAPRETICLARRMEWIA